MKSKKPGSNQIVRRRLRILDMMSPTRKKTRAIFDALNDEGIEVKNIKTVQDDLQSLRDDFPNIVEARDEGGYFTYKKPSQDFINKRKSSSMSPQEARNGPLRTLPQCTPTHPQWAPYALSRALNEPSRNPPWCSRCPLPLGSALEPTFRYKVTVTLTFHQHSRSYSHSLSHSRSQSSS